VRAMATDVTVHVRTGRDGDAAAALEAALAVFPEVEAACTRFDPSSALMRMNARPDEWHRVPPVLYEALVAAHRAYLRTRGRFDPRVLRDLVRLGYDRSLAFEAGDVVTGGAVAGDVVTGGAVAGGVVTGGAVTGRTPSTRSPLPRWTPRFRGGLRPEVHPGGVAVDLGGIGKGLAVRWAAERLAARIDDFLIDAGGDCACRGGDAGGDGWRIGVEDPLGGERPLAVLELRDAACATSSIRLRRWRSGHRTVHHLIDPRTGSPGGDGLLAVTVVADDPAEAEVESKSAFLSGADGIAAAVGRRGLAALWVAEDGTVAESAQLERHVIWRAA
jgi:FAD:protein FMN transferase